MCTTVAALSASHLQPSEAEADPPAPDVSVPDILPLDTPAQPTAIMQAESTFADEIELPATLPTAEARTSITMKAANILCVLDIADPHHSTHKPRRINVVARVNCNVPVPQISLGVGLYRNTHLVGKDSGATFGRRWNKQTASSLCTNENRTYQGLAKGAVLFPPGTTPPTATSQAISHAKRLRCPR
ncbi:MAG TPA: hypothetical protein VNQ53_01985 [Nocardioides sp.]|nr:hypothetical protein [Nocardioides sp.]